MALITKGMIDCLMESRDHHDKFVEEFKAIGLKLLSYSEYVRTFDQIACCEKAALKISNYDHKEHYRLIHDILNQNMIRFYRATHTLLTNYKDNKRIRIIPMMKIGCNLHTE